MTANRPPLSALANLAAGRALGVFGVGVAVGEGPDGAPVVLVGQRHMANPSTPQRITCAARYKNAKDRNPISKQADIFLSINRPLPRRRTATVDVVEEEHKDVMESRSIVINYQNRFSLSRNFFPAVPRPHNHQVPVEQRKHFRPAFVPKVALAISGARFTLNGVGARVAEGFTPFHISPSMRARLARNAAA